MEAFIQDVLIQISCYLGFAVFILFGLNFMSNKFFFTWFGVKTSQGRKILVKVRSVIQDYYRPGKIESGFVVFKGTNKETRRLSVGESSVYRSAGVNVIDVDDVKNCSIARDFSKVPGYDAEKHESLYLRALYKPSLMDDKTKILMVLMIVILLGLAALGYFGYMWQAAILESVNSLKQVPAEVAGAVATAGGV